MISVTRTPWKRPPERDTGDGLFAVAAACLVLLLALWSPLIYRAWQSSQCNWATLQNCRAGW